jgi:hypothetical protein
MGDAVGTRPADQLVEHRQGVSYRTAAGAYDQRHCRLLDLDTLGFAQLGDVFAQHLGRDQPERIVMGAAAYRTDHLVWRSGGEDETQVWWGLLDQLEQGVVSGRRDHMRLVDDVDLVARRDRREESPLSQVSGVVNPAMTRRVDLDYVDRAGTCSPQILARLALTAWLGDRCLSTVERAGQDACARGLAAATGAGEQVGVMHPVVGQRLLDRRGHVILADDLSKRVGAVSPVQSQGCIHPTNPIAAR